MPKTPKTPKTTNAAAATATSAHATLRARGQLTLPLEVREALHVDSGDEILFEVADNVVVLHAGTWIPRDQAWFWTDDWQAGEAEASDDLRTGRTRIAKTADEFFEDLNR
jgi:bifunctional DNA-binding transcriptional regulator/antitoxin component of YhaV-PrlF toxin-antitoxin module